jgi:hypothetical protein
MPDHVRLLYPDEARHILDWLACRATPDIKINHAVVFGSSPGSAEHNPRPDPSRVGPWVSARPRPAMLNRFNGFPKSVILRVNGRATSASSIVRIVRP